MLETPDAAPTWFSGTDAVAADEAGPLDSPIPTATATSGSTKAAYRQSASANPTAANPTAVSTNPIPMTWRPPNRLATRGTKGATATNPAVAGSVAKPACKGLRSSVSGLWK